MTPQFTSLMDAKTTTCVENAALGTTLELLDRAGQQVQLFAQLDVLAGEDVLGGFVFHQTTEYVGHARLGAQSGVLHARGGLGVHQAGELRGHEHEIGRAHV